MMFPMLSTSEEVAADDRWIVSRPVAGIELYSEFQPDLQAVETAIGSVRTELTEILGVLTSTSTIQVMLFRDQQSYLAYLGNRVPQARQRRAIYYRNGDVHQVYAWNSRSLITDVRHEMTHAVLHQHLAFLPLWLDEGLAENLEESREDREKSRRTVASRWKAKVGWKPSLTELENLPSAESMTADHYRDSWALVCFLLNDSDESRKLLTSYLAEIHRGEAPGKFSRYAEAKSPGLLSGANSYFRKFSIRVASDSSP